MISFVFLIILFIYDPNQLMIPTSICGFSYNTIIMLYFRGIVMLQVSCSFYINDYDHSSIAPVLSSLNEYYR